MVKKHNEYHIKVEQYEKMDTLIFLFNDFIEYNPNPKSIALEELTFSTSGCFGTCPVFEISLVKERIASFNAIKYNDSNGQFSTIINSVSYNRIIQIINYIDLGKLKTEYAVDWTDDQTGKINFKFSGQDIKVIDYGLIGTFGLEILYNQLFLLRNSQNWK